MRMIHTKKSKRILSSVLMLLLKVPSVFKRGESYLKSLYSKKIFKLHYLTNLFMKF